MNMNYMNLSLAWMGALNMALALYGCTNGIETGLSAPEGIPVRSDKGDKDKKGKWDGGFPIGQLSV